MWTMKEDDMIKIMSQNYVDFQDLDIRSKDKLIMEICKRLLKLEKHHE